jgi:hypothetical protein
MPAALEVAGADSSDEQATEVTASQVTDEASTREGRMHPAYARISPQLLTVRRIPLFSESHQTLMGTPRAEGAKILTQSRFALPLGDGPPPTIEEED